MVATASFSVPGVEVLLAPAEAFHGREKLGLGGFEHRAAREADEIAPAVFALVHPATNFLYAGPVARVWAGTGIMMSLRWDRYGRDQRRGALPHPTY